LIQHLSLKPSGLALIHPEKEKAMNAIEQRGTAALRPLLQALEHSDEDVKGTIIYLLSRIQDNRTAILPIAKQLKDQSPNVRNEAICALEGFAPEDISDSEVVNYLTLATSDKVIEIRNKANEILAKLNVHTAELPWYKGAETWQEIADTFIQLEMPKENADYKGLGKMLQEFSAEERHGAWTYIAGKLDIFDKIKSMRCYIEALYHDPDPNSVAWGWLNGQYDTEMNILPSNSPRTRETVENMRQKYRPIIEE
jgi:hypothetical protein